MVLLGSYTFPWAINNLNPDAEQKTGQILVVIEVRFSKVYGYLLILRINYVHYVPDKTQNE